VLVSKIAAAATRIASRVVCLLEGTWCSEGDTKTVSRDGHRGDLVSPRSGGVA